MDLFYMSIKQNIKLIFLVLLLLFSFMSISMTHGFVEMNCHNGHESLFKYVLSQRESITKSKKIIKKLKAIFYRILKLLKILSNVTVISRAYLELFNLRFSKVTILHLFSFLCFCFNAGKYKQFIKCSDLLPSMAV
jgi:hypothetical protein